MRKQRGVALITVLLIVVIVTVVCASMIARQHLAIRTTANQVLARQAWHYALGGEVLAKAILRRDTQADKTNGSIDHLGEAWARPLPALPIEAGAINVRIEDLAGRFNLNSLVQNQQPNTAAIAQFRRLLLQLGIEAPYAERLVDWQDRDQSPGQLYGAEDLEYQRLDPPYRTADRRLYDVSELRLLLDMRDADYQRLAPLVSALPEDAAININTASAPVIASLDDKLSLDTIAAALQERPAKGFRDIASFLAQPALSGTELKGTQLAVKSQYFQVTSEVRLGGRRLVLASLLKREDDGSIRVLQRNFGQPPRLLNEGD
ncbi:type II secretion system minor pseudopilin GspK [Azomonas macrocytogenes]|uniref:Type II secretion system protein K n=1 Tax=Azomonas macrocytogenes TaxID=69962 RepID=A0A839T3H9_AZOMA|nr:general secretion pathway protein K [Azomonas macrocytogenes]